MGHDGVGYDTQEVAVVLSLNGIAERKAVQSRLDYF
jgi:hypothetical protein